MWIFHLYFSELYFILYELYKFAVILVLFYFLVHNFGALGIPSLGTQHHCQAGPTATLAGRTGTRPTGQFNGRELARSRCRAFVTAMAGVARRDRAREGSRSTRKHKTSHTRVMPLCFGHRRQLMEQWRTAALASEAVDLGDGHISLFNGHILHSIVFYNHFYKYFTQPHFTSHFFITFVYTSSSFYHLHLQLSWHRLPISPPIHLTRSLLHNVRRTTVMIGLQIPFQLQSFRQIGRAHV